MITDYHAKYYAYELTRQCAADGVERLSQSLFDATVDLNPHQINAALFALNNPLNKGVILADEVGLGKTIEAGLVLCQYWAERKRQLLIICPASLRKQWAQELQDKFNLPSQILDANTWRQLKNQGIANPLNNHCINILSYHFAARLEEYLLVEPWHLVVMDEAHKLRNAYRPNNKMGQALKRALYGRQKLLLTATPLQNSLLELYGLSTLLDEQLFGDDKSFRQHYMGSDGIGQLKDRLKGFVKRTLRKQVLEYIRYTQRKAITVPFTPSHAEMQLYNGITAVLEREESYALPKRQRHLTGLILRKLLASSTHAVLNTLVTIKNRLEKLRDNQSDDTDIIAELIENDDLETDYLEELDNADQNEPEQVIDKAQLELEIIELSSLIGQAEKITDDSKAKALLIALNQGFEQMAAMAAPRKAVIFTESRRTQEYLQNYLAANNYADKLVTFSGTNNSPETTRIYQQWLAENQGSDKIAGSPQIDRRTALIDHFQDHAEIMIATEAGAEGVNMQFCSLVINYDLPWNPQRVEQRIGRCHRYGQKFDVVVINFLNQSNYADQRVLELLTDKFHLFDGVFGASDDVLGSIESGIDFEKRIQAIYESCRTIEQIEAAFSQLQQEMEVDINKQMQETRQQLLDNFDEDIHDLLKLQLDQAEQRLDKISRWFWAVTQHQLKPYSSFDDQQHRFQLQKNVIKEASLGHYQLIARHQKQNTNTHNTHVYRLNHPLGEWVLETAKNQPTPTAQIHFDYAAHGAKITVLESLLGQSGTLKLQRFSIEALERNEDHLLFAAETDDGKLLPVETAQKLMQLPANHCHQQSVLLKPQIDEALAAAQNELIKRVNSRNLAFFEEEVNKLDHWADDLKFGLEQSIKDIDQQIKEVRRNAKIAPTLAEKLAFQKQQQELERTRNKQRKELFDRQDEIDERREVLIGQLESKLNQKIEIQDLFTISWGLQ
ncbi:MAG: SNF2-related protein [Methylovulum sp.]|uniref:SNF2-related protein n=1 Tax=Methylovulum sp. TaxID=1916980 RepID=UPI00260FBA89|nr:SNF2-related protein [Methylovulum sp.]MDD2722908.1 SNF2-related protein [Methylovulum sp.]MDD5124865.1 SNF2-related protein [Methylovulum sp.]